MVSDITRRHYETILDSMQTDKEYKASEIAEILELKVPHTRKLLNDLIQKQEIEAIGSK